MIGTMIKREIIEMVMNNGINIVHRPSVPIQPTHSTDKRRNQYSTLEEDVQNGTILIATLHTEVLIIC